jgi:Putative adhesin
MPRWTIDTPTTVNFDGVVALRVRLVSGSVAVLAADDEPAVDVAAVSGQPLLVTHEAGILTVSYEDMTWEGLLGWLRPQRHTATVTITVPADCPVQLGVVNASAVISGMSARTSVKSVSGEITLDGITGDIDANTVSGDMEAQGVDGGIRFKTLSGDLTVADALLGLLDAKTVSGRVTADFELSPAGSVQAATVSGDVAIRVPASTGAQVDLRSASGRVDSVFEGLLGGRTPTPASVTGTLGAGDGRLSVSTVSGSVALLRRNPAGEAADDPAAGGTGGTGAADSGPDGMGAAQPTGSEPPEVGER